ncbi:hypothetical protein HK103_006496 [Boothiomyces macroporosus]|uniref:Uncharacterized protein n=1 Tax=Boothiomyces macroporosus TaxID=261099 RepID=A0AAD5UNX9_9FUNG|nr:hypothetical protein HK103_006496 [Boothiomyces macroporosus]
MQRFLAMGAQTPDLGYYLSASPNSDGSVSITVNHPTFATFTGILIYVNTASSPNRHLGSFSYNPVKYKTLSQFACLGDFVTQPYLNSTITHTNPNPITFSQAVVTWYGSSQEVAITDLQVMAMVGGTVDSAGFPAWQVLPVLPLASIVQQAQTLYAAQPSPAATTSNSVYPPVSSVQSSQVPAATYVALTSAVIPSGSGHLSNSQYLYCSISATASALLLFAWFF